MHLLVHTLPPEPTPIFHLFKTIISGFTVMENWHILRPKSSLSLHLCMDGFNCRRKVGRTVTVGSFTHITFLWVWERADNPARFNPIAIDLSSGQGVTPDRKLLGESAQGSRSWACMQLVVFDFWIHRKATLLKQKNLLYVICLFCRLSLIVCSLKLKKKTKGLELSSVPRPSIWSSVLQNKWMNECINKYQ